MLAGISYTSRSAFECLKDGSYYVYLRSWVHEAFCYDGCLQMTILLMIVCYSYSTCDDVVVDILLLSRKIFLLMGKKNRKKIKVCYKLWDPDLFQIIKRSYGSINTQWRHERVCVYLECLTESFLVLFVFKYNITFPHKKSTPMRFLGAIFDCFRLIIILNLFWVSIRSYWRYDILSYGDMILYYYDSSS